MILMFGIALLDVKRRRMKLDVLSLILQH